MTFICKTITVQTMIHLFKGRQATMQIDQGIFWEKSKVMMLSISRMVCSFSLLLIHVPGYRWSKDFYLGKRGKYEVRIFIHYTYYKTTHCILQGGLTCRSCHSAGLTGMAYWFINQVYSSPLQWNKRLSSVVLTYGWSSSDGDKYAQTELIYLVFYQVADKPVKIVRTGDAPCLTTLPDCGTLPG